MTATTLTLALLAALLTTVAHALCLCSNATSVYFDCTPGNGGTFPSSVWKISCREDGGVFGGNETWPNFEGLDFLQEFYIDDVSVAGQLDVLSDLANLTVLWTGPSVELKNFPEGLARSSSLQNLTITSSELQSVYGKFWVVQSLVKVELNSTELECLSPLSLATKASVSLNGGESVCLTRFWDDVENKHTSFFAFFFSVGMIAVIASFVACCSIPVLIDMDILPDDTVETGTTRSNGAPETCSYLKCLCFGLIFCFIGSSLLVTNFGSELWRPGNLIIYSDPLAAEPNMAEVMEDRYQTGRVLALASVVPHTLILVAVYLLNRSNLVVEAGSSGCFGLLTFSMAIVIFIVVATITLLLLLIPAAGAIRYPDLRTSYLSICPQQGVCANATHFWDWQAEAYTEFSSPYFSSHPIYSIYISDPSVPASYYEIESRFGNYPSYVEKPYERHQYDTEVLNEIYHIANTLRYFGNLDQEFSRATLCREIDASWEGACPIAAYVDVYSRSFYEHPIFQSVLLFALLLPGALFGIFILVMLLTLMCYGKTNSSSVMGDRPKQVEDIEGMVFPMDEITNTVPRVL